MFGDCRKRRVERGRKFTHRLFPFGQKLQETPARGVRKRGESEIEGGRFIFNHVVEYIIGRVESQAPENGGGHDARNGRSEGGHRRAERPQRKGATTRDDIGDEGGSGGIRPAPREAGTETIRRRTRDESRLR